MICIIVPKRKRQKQKELKCFLKYDYKHFFLKMWKL